MEYGWKALAIVLVALGGTVAAAGASDAASKWVGLILQVSGPVQSKITAFDEVSVGQRIVLSGGSTITVLHYKKCQRILVQGGEVLIERNDVSVQRGVSEKRVDTKCPKMISLGEDAQIGGLLLRSSKRLGSLKLATQLSFMVVGAGYRDVGDVRIRRYGGDPDHYVYEGGLSGRSFTWPAGRAPLRPKTTYIVELHSRSGIKTKRVTFEAIDNRRQPRMILICLD